MSPTAAEMIMAPRTAVGRSAIGAVRKSSTTATGRRGEQAGELAAGAHRVVDGGPRPAGSDRQPLGDARGYLRGTDGEELLVDPDVLVVLAREGARGEGRVGEAHEEDADRGGQQGER